MKQPWHFSRTHIQIICEEKPANLFPEAVAKARERARKAGYENLLEDALKVRSCAGVQVILDYAYSERLGIDKARNLSCAHLVKRVHAMKGAKDYLAALASVDPKQAQNRS